jgi:hypothetical protein
MNIRPVTTTDVQFLKTMLYEAASWNPDWPREPMEVLFDPIAVLPWAGDARATAGCESTGWPERPVPLFHGGARLRLRGR